MTITMTVKAKAGAVVYDIDGNRIPDGQYVAVPISPGVVTAVKAGDLDESEAEDLPHRVLDDLARHDEAEKKPHERSRKHRGQTSDSGFGL